MVIFCAGIDLSASESKPSGVSVLAIRENAEIELLFVGRLRGDEEIVDTLLRYGARLVAVDSPLSLPRGRYYRNVDLKLKRMGFNVLPPAWRAMTQLTLRTMRLAEELKRHGVLVLETHPSSCVKASGCRTFQELVTAISLKVPANLCRDEKDAVIAALACVFHVTGRSVVVEADDGTVVLLPRICSSDPSQRLGS